MPQALNRINALVLAGGMNHIPLYDGYTPDYKALLSFAGKTSLRYTLDALRAAPEIARICITGSVDRLRPIADSDGTSYEFEPGGETLLDSLYTGLTHFASSELVLVVTADAPLVTAAAVSAFLAACAPVDTSYAHNLFLSVVPERSFTGAYADVRKHYNRFRDIAICHGNLMLANPHLINDPKITRRINSLYNSRKSPIDSALSLGLHVGVSYVLGVHMWHLLTLQQMADIASRRFGLGLIPVITEHPEITVDVDEPADYEFVQARFAAMAEK